MFDDLKEKIYKDKPFSDILNIVNIERLDDCKDSEFDLKLRYYGVPLQIQDSNGKFYKIRAKPSTGEAKKNERLIRLIPDILPKFYGRDRNYLLFDFLQGRTSAENENPDILFKIGKICGQVNRLKAKGNKKQELEESYCQKINYFFENGKISLRDCRRTLRIYKKLIMKIKYEVVLGFNDIRKSNFMIGLQDKLYFVDEDGIEYNIKGYSFDNIMLRLYFPHVPHESSEKYIKTFILGYNSVNSLNFLNEEYMRLLNFLFLIDNALYLLNMGKINGLESQLRRLLRLEW